MNGLLLCAALTGGAAGCASLDQEERVVVSTEVVEAVRTHGSAEVVVALSPPAGYEDGVDSEGVRREIARWQDSVLGELGAEDFRLRHRYEAVPALAGTILSERAVRVLNGHPRVTRVDLDVGGGGGGGIDDRVDIRRSAQ